LRKLLFGVQGSVNKISKIVNLIQQEQVLIQEEWYNPGDLMYYGIDGSVKYS
jgi:hypothetical protein